MNRRHRDRVYSNRHRKLKFPSLPRAAAAAGTAFMVESPGRQDATLRIDDSFPVLYDPTVGSEDSPLVDGCNVAVVSSQAEESSGLERKMGGLSLQTAGGCPILVCLICFVISDFFFSFTRIGCDGVCEPAVRGSLVYPCPLPELGLELRRAQQNRMLGAEKFRFIREFGEFLHVLVRCPSKSDYDVYCRTIVECYPVFAESRCKHPWV